MKSREQFIAEYADEMTGLLLASFAHAEQRMPAEQQPLDLATKGRQMLLQMKRARDLLGRIYDHDVNLQPPGQLAKANGQPAKRMT